MSGERHTRGGEGAQAKQPSRPAAVFATPLLARECSAKSLCDSPPLRIIRGVDDIWDLVSDSGHDVARDHGNDTIKTPVGKYSERVSGNKSLAIDAAPSTRITPESAPALVSRSICLAFMK